MPRNQKEDYKNRKKELIVDVQQQNANQINVHVLRIVKNVAKTVIVIGVNVKIFKTLYLKNNEKKKNR